MYQYNSVFQFTLPCGERRHCGIALHAISTFQFTLPCGERPARKSPGSMSDCFNSRSRAGSDYRISYQTAIATWFQFTLPCGERHQCIWCRRAGCSCFNSRSRAGSDLSECTDPRVIEVSIHAPVRGATLRLACGRYCKTVSIHAPVRGATDAASSKTVNYVSFNSRSRAGSDCHKIN